MVPEERHDEVVIKSLGFLELDLSLNSQLLYTSCVTLNKLLNLSEA